MYPLTALLVVMIALVLFPVSTTLTRCAVVLALAALWLGAVIRWRNQRTVAVTILAIGCATLAFPLFPGTSIDTASVRERYLSRLRAHEGTLYVWGGENGIGIDCSGLVRRSLIEALHKEALLRLNPAALRSAMDLWWHDSSARALRDGYRRSTTTIGTAASLNVATEASLRPGDFAVTADGVHVLAYLGQSTWIEADPQAMRVIQVTTPSTSGWFNTPVHFMRWTLFAGEE